MSIRNFCILGAMQSNGSATNKYINKNYSDLSLLAISCMDINNLVKAQKIFSNMRKSHNLKN